MSSSVLVSNYFDSLLLEVNEVDSSIETKQIGVQTDDWLILLEGGQRVIDTPICIQIMIVVPFLDEQREW